MNGVQFILVPGMMRMLSIALIALVAGCGGGGEPPATRTSVLVYGPEEDPRQPVVVRSFDVRPESVPGGTPARAHVRLDGARPRQQISVDWYGPDGWLVAYETRPAAEASLEFDAPVRAFDEPGRYRAVLRAGTRPLAEDTLTVTG